FELFESGAIEGKAFTLRVGSEWAAAVRTFLPSKSEPLEVFEHGRDELRFASRAIQVFVAEYQYAVTSEDTLLRGPESSCVAKMQKAGGRGGKTAAIER